MHQNSRLLFRKYAKKHFVSGMRVLEIGPAKIPSTYQKIVDDDSLIWHTLDIRVDPKLTYSGASEYEFPVPDEAYEIVLSGQVIEHVRKIWIWIKEIARLCRPEGLVIVINPVSWPYHEAPVDCWRMYPEGMKALYEEAGLDVLFSTFECLEEREDSEYVPGKSLAHQGWRRQLASWLLKKDGFPIERAVDTITIGRKRSTRSRSGAVLMD